MRTKNVLLNGIWSLISFAVLAILGIFVQKVFTVYLSVELLGLDNLFKSILSVLALAELGVSNVISYNLYKEIASDNRSEINKLMSIYRMFYFCIGAFVALASIVLFFFLPIIIKSPEIKWSYINSAYIIQILSIISTYWLAYKRTLFIADQKEYMILKIDSAFNTVSNICKVLVIMIFKNYMIYALTTLAFNILANIYISTRAKKEYAFLESVKISKADFIQRSVFKDIKNFMIHKISYTVYNSAGNIITSTAMGLQYVGLASNYALLEKSIYSVFNRCFQGMIPSVGNILYEGNSDKSYRLYNMLDLIYFIFSVILGSVFLNLLQPFVHLVFGESYLLSWGYVLILTAKNVLMMQFEVAYIFRSTRGEYENDRKYMLYSAVTAIVISLMLVRKFGLTGILLGNTAGGFFIIYGRAQFVYRQIFSKSMYPYWKKHIVLTILSAVELGATFFLCLFIPGYSFFTILLRGMITTIFLVIFNIALFYRTAEFKEFTNYLINIFFQVRKVILSQKRTREN